MEVPTTVTPPEEEAPLRLPSNAGIRPIEAEVATIFVNSVRDYAMFVLDPGGHIMSWNRGAELIKGYKASEIVGRHFSQFYMPADVARGWPDYELQVARREGRFEDEGWRVRADGSRFWANVVITALFSDNGELRGFAKITRDLSERERQARALRESEERFRLLVEGVTDYAILMLDPQGFIANWNAGAQQLHGFDASEIVGRHFGLFYPAEDLNRNLPLRQLEEARRTGRSQAEGWQLRKDGSRFRAATVVTALFDEERNVKGYSRVTRDLTERKAFEESLRQSDERFRLLVDSVLDYAIFMLNPDGVIASWNAGAERIKGYRAEEIIGRHFSCFYPEEAKARRWPEQELALAASEGRFEDEGWRVRKDGTRFWANVTISAVYDDQGCLRGYAKVTRDMTERKRAEALEQDRRQIDEFLAMLSHELRNPLAPIRNALGLLSLDPPQTDAGRRARDVIDRQVGHLTKLVDDLLDVSRITRGQIVLETRPVDLLGIVQAALEAVQPEMEARRHRVEFNRPAQPVLVRGDGVRLTQVFVNLLTNAAKYTPSPGLIFMSVTSQGDNVVVSVRDNGIGIPRPLLPKIFNIFVQGERSLARSEGGLGIGLHVVKRLVEMHGGSISAQSAGMGQGSQFMVALPLLGEASEPITAEPASVQPAPEDSKAAVQRHILIVDDNVDSAVSLALLLRELGQRADTVETGVEALGYVARETPDIVLLDIGLPDVNGYEVAARMRAMPSLQGTLIAAMTGYGQREDVENSMRAGCDLHLVKPVEFGEVTGLLTHPKLVARDAERA